MGNNSSSDNSFKMGIYLIGDNINEFHQLMEEIKQNKNKLENYWTYNCYNDSKTNYESQIDKYYSFLLSIKEDITIDLSQTLKHVLIVEVKNKLDKEKIEYLLKKLNNIKNISYNPLVLFLFDEYLNNDESLDINWEEYLYIDPRTIFIGPFISKKIKNYMEIYELKIKKLLYRFCIMN